MRSTSIAMEPAALAELLDVEVEQLDTASSTSPRARSSKVDGDTPAAGFGM